MTPILPTLAVPLSITHPSDVLDMPVDPNEPTYCLCHQVSYGEMIGCDNPDVSSHKNNSVESKSSNICSLHTYDCSVQYQVWVYTIYSVLFAP